MTRQVERISSISAAEPADFPVHIAVVGCGPIIFDGRNLFDCTTMAREGFTYICIGRPATEECGEDLQLTRRVS